ncbi:phosphoadenylyl-sulfate reductase [Rhodovibrio salinarum]|uniref:Adenosine 5'-phosphosulfate reductase n=1 Tax=Rhodovibrio salinarum TaxID=1087 RepID=A0A934QHM4_9PROT|nr:phosphoadenylyl-sulfate reductase [Rhodovibrio salinarum]MBK1696937.1 phosphoadenylyl-sulfate reductase [Rhodovibrio salinarum]
MDGSTPITPLDRQRALERDAEGLTGEELLALAITRHFPGTITAVSSFGAEAALLLDMISRIDPATPVIFLETGKHFPETLRYRDRLIAKLGLTGVRNEQPDEADRKQTDPDGHLWSVNPDRCCALRKVRPLERALTGFDAWITGRKRFQTATREGLPRVELVDGRVKVNPLADWTQNDVDAAFNARGLPRHPLVDQGYPSIGCLPCTRRVAEGENARAGRWSGMEKTECGIHNAWWAQQGSGSGI